MPLRCQSFSSSARSRAAVLDGIREVARVRRELDLLQAEITAALSKHRGRDTTAAVARTMRSSTREARNAAKVGRVLDSVRGAREALLAGDVTEEHLRALAPVCTEADASDLLVVAAEQSPEDFAQTVRRHRIRKDPEGWRQRQHRARSVRFFDADDVCIGIRAILPTTSGTRVKQHLRNMVDTKWRTDHPERAKVRGSHGGDSAEQRLADALVDAIVGTHPTNTEPEERASPSSDTAKRETRATRNKRPTTSRVDLVVTIDAATLEAEIVGQGPIPLADALDLAPQAHLYAMIRDTNWGNLKLGRNRRLASPLQRLAVMIRDRGRCRVDGCDEPADRCDVHHFDHFTNGGKTDIELLGLLCRPSHHPHEHETTRHIRTIRKRKRSTRPKPSAKRTRRRGEPDVADIMTG